MLRDRRHLSDDGLVLVLARIDASDGSLAGEVEVVTRGFAGDDAQLIEETRLEVERSLAASAEQRVTEVGVLQHQIHDAVAGLLGAGPSGRWCCPRSSRPRSRARWTATESHAPPDGRSAPPSGWFGAAGVRGSRFC